MANYHLTVKMLSRSGGKSCVAALAYRSAAALEDRRTGEAWHYPDKAVAHVEILVPEDAPNWIVDIAEECKTDRQSALQKFSDSCEAAEKRKDSQVYREVEFSLPRELNEEQNIAWANEFVKDVLVRRGMVAVMNFHFDIDPKTGEDKPHCHVVLTTRHLTEGGLGLKNRDWNTRGLVDELRDQCAQYQNAALKAHGFEAQVSHLSYADREVDIDPQPKLGSNVREMTRRGIETARQKIFEAVRLKNQFRILKNPDIVFSIVTASHATFTRKDIAKVLNRYIDDPDQFRILFERLMASKELVSLESLGVHKSEEPVYTTQDMLRVEMNLARQAESLSTQETHPVSPQIVEKVIAKYNQKLEEHGGLSPDQQAAIRHMLSASRISCVVGFAGAGKTTCLEAVKEAWEEAGYRVLGLAPTGRAQQNIEGSGIRSMTIHKFLWAHRKGWEKLSARTVVVGDEFGMVDSRRCSELLSLVEAAGAKIVPMGDGHQAQSVEAGPAFRLLTRRVKPAILEKVVRQKVDWQREATQLFGTGKTREALKLYQEHGCISIIPEKAPDLRDKNALIDNFCRTRQVSGRIWQEMMEDFKAQFGKDVAFDPEKDFKVVSTHPDFALFQHWKKMRQTLAGAIAADYPNQRTRLKAKGADVTALDALVGAWTASPSDPALFGRIETILRDMSYTHIADTREQARQALVASWAEDRGAFPDESHLMLAFSRKDASRLNEAARILMRQQGHIQGRDFLVATQSIETDDFGVERKKHHQRTFAKGDRLLFTRNHNGLKVKNGSLGTILSIDRQKIQVRLDDLGSQEGRTVSFSPNLYPFIDNGWATTVLKAQGANIHHVKFLGSFELYRNIAYVAMSRHLRTLKVFCSNLDFWREEKVIDRLSRVQEKLSGFDYLDADKIEEKLAEDTAILWHAKKIQQAKDFWAALKVTAREAAGIVFGNFEPDRLASDSKTEDPGQEVSRREVLKREIREEFLSFSFEDTEEVRSRDFFADSSDARKGTFEGEGGQAASPGAAQNGKNGRSQPPPNLPETLPKPPESSKGRSPDHPEQGKVAPSSPETFAERLKPVQDKINREYETRIIVWEKVVSSQEIEGQLRERIYELATSLFGEPNKYSRNANFLRFGKLNEISVGIRGKQQGVYTNFAADGKGTGPLGMIEGHFGYSRQDAKKWALEWLGGNPTVIERKVVAKAPESKESTWKPITPIPATAGEPDIAGNRYLNGMFKDGSKPSTLHAYRDAYGQLLGYAVRIEKPPIVQPDGSAKIPKVVLPLGYGENAKGFKYWKWQGFFEDGKKTPYGIEKLARDPDKPVLIVEGEKTADIAQKALPHYHVLTWMGGAGNVGGTNWDCLVGKTVTIWPDYDEAGQKAAQKLQNILTRLNKGTGQEGRVGVVRLPAHWRDHPDYRLKDGWDLGDPLPKGWTWDTVVGMIRDAVRQGEQEEEGVKDASVPSSFKARPDPKPADPLAGKREAFEAARLPINQEWCASLGFLMQHGRLPGTQEELAEGWWQGERLTAVEGRLYRETLKGKKKVDEKQLTLRARGELTKNQAVPDEILTFGKACDLTETQLSQLEQHALIHRDKTNQLPTPSDLEAICQVLTRHADMMGAAKAHDRAQGQGMPASPATSQPPNKPQGPPERNLEDTPIKTDYRALVEQQALLTHVLNRGTEVDGEGKAILKGVSPILFKHPEIQNSCSDRLRRMEGKLEAAEAFSKEMKAIDLRRQNQRGMDV